MRTLAVRPIVRSDWDRPKGARRARRKEAPWSIPILPQAQSPVQGLFFGGEGGMRTLAVRPIAGSDWDRPKGARRARRKEAPWSIPIPPQTQSPFRGFFFGGEGGMRTLAVRPIAGSDLDRPAGARRARRRRRLRQFRRKSDLLPLLILPVLGQHLFHYRLPRNPMSLRRPFAQIDELATPGAERPLGKSGRHQNFFFAGGTPDG